MKTIKVSSRIKESGIQELIGADETVATDEYSEPTSFDLSPIGSSGEVLGFSIYNLVTGSGEILEPFGNIFFFDADPSISVGASEMSMLARQMVFAKEAVASGNWEADVSGASYSKALDPPQPFHKMSTMYLAWGHTSASGFNNVAADDETLSVNVWYRLTGEGQ